MNSWKNLPGGKVGEQSGSYSAQENSFDFINENEDSREVSPIDQKLEEAKAFLGPRRRLFSIFARDSSLHFEPSGSAETFAFYPNDFTVEVPLDWFASERFNDGELEFANYHELAHFIDMRKNPQAFLDNFARMQSRANELADEYLQSHPNEASRDVLSAFFYRELHTLYNCLDDIYVNEIVASRIHKFDSGDGREDVVSLYQKNGFGDADQTGQPLHRQMAYSLLRDEMVGSELGKSIVSEEVAEVLSRRFLGQTIPEIINTRLKPQRGVLVDPAERYQIIRTVIEPAYLELLQKALQKKDDQDKNNASGGASQEEQNSRDGEEQAHDQQGQSNDRSEESRDSEGSLSDFDPFGDNDSSSSARSDDILDKGVNGDSVTEEILKSFKEQDEIDNMSPEERASHEQEKRQKAFDEKHGITESEREEDTRIKEEISRVRREMREFWKGLIGKAVEYHSVTEHRQRRGRLDVDEFIRQYPQMIEAEQNCALKELHVYDRKGLERTIIDQPELIEVSLVVDCSGSMDGLRTHMAKQTTALLLYSLKDFNTELDRSRRRTHSELRADTQVICFGSDFAEVKPFDRTAMTNGASEANIIKCISAVNSGYGGTNDALPFSAIEEGITVNDRVRMRDRKLMKIVFEITDGETSNPDMTAGVVRRLAEDGVIMVSFRIGDISPSEERGFHHIWSGDSPRQNVKGITIGENLDILPKELMSALSNILSNIRI